MVLIILTYVQVFNTYLFITWVLFTSDIKAVSGQMIDIFTDDTAIIAVADNYDDSIRKAQNAFTCKESLSNK